MTVRQKLTARYLSHGAVILFETRHLTIFDCGDMIQTFEWDDAGYCTGQTWRKA